MTAGHCQRAAEPADARCVKAVVAVSAAGPPGADHFRINQGAATRASRRKGLSVTPAMGASIT